MYIIEVSVALIALAFIVLVYYLVKTLISARRSLEQVNASLSRVERQVEDLSQESVRLIQSTQLVTQDIHEKLQSMNLLFQSASRVSDAVNEVTSSVKQVSSALSHTVTNNVEKAVRYNEKSGSDMMQWVTLTLGLFSKWKGYRDAKHHRS